LKEDISTEYRYVVEFIDFLSNIKEKLALDKILHFTTLQKFVIRILSSLFNPLPSRILKFFYSYGENVFVVAINAAGLYECICKLLLFQKNWKLRRSFLITSISVDTGKKVILGWKISNKQIMESNMQML
jgi:hypothetical protein